MNWVDLLIILLLLLFTFEGFGRSFIGESLDFLSFLLAFFLSLRFYNYLSDFYQSNFHIPHSLANVLGFISIWFIIEVLLFSLVHYLIQKIRVLAILNKHLSFFATIPAFLKGVIFISIILLLVTTFPIQPRLKKEVSSSKLGTYILHKTHALETPLKNALGGITKDTLAFLTIKPKSNEIVDLGFHTLEFQESPTIETQMIELVNKERTFRGLKRLAYDEKLKEVGRVHSADMFKRGYFSHYSPEGENVADRAEKRGVVYLVIGENLAYAPSLELAHNGLMNSEGHKANILSEDFGKIGIGVIDGGVYGLMITQVFSN